MAANTEPAKSSTTEPAKPINWVFAALSAALALVSLGGLIADSVYATNHGNISCEVAWTEVRETTSEKGVESRWVSGISMRCGDVFIKTGRKGKSLGFSDEKWDALVVGMSFTCTHWRTVGFLFGKSNMLTNCK